MYKLDPSGRDTSTPMRGTHKLQEDSTSHRVEESTENRWLAHRTSPTTRIMRAELSQQCGLWTLFVRRYSFSLPSPHGYNHQIGVLPCRYLTLLGNIPAVLEGSHHQTKRETKPTIGPMTAASLVQTCCLGAGRCPPFPELRPNPMSHPGNLSDFPYSPAPCFTSITLSSIDGPAR